VTTSEDAADERNRTTSEERDATLRVLRERGVPFDFQPRLADAVRDALDGVEGDDLVLLLGAQGMDAGAAMVREALGGSAGGRVTGSAAGTVASAR
jgi:UDP-N-acetylmuramoyl-L-alanyl-D-glutamate--2,6-diaminopimelate ligase